MTLIGFLSDLGLHDDAVGLCKGLMHRICAGVTVVDISHAVTPFDVYEGCHYLSNVAEFFPTDTVFACFVYPETGSELACIAVRNDNDQIFVAPNNGLLTNALANSGVREAYVISSLDVVVPNPTHTFWGRDIVVSAAAHLANGFPLQALGRAISVQEIRHLPIPTAHLTTRNTIAGEISLIDKNYGNVWTNISSKMLAAVGIGYGSEIELHLESGLLLRGRLLRSFHEVTKGAILLYINSRGHLSIAMNQESFLKHHQIHRHTRLTVSHSAPASMQPEQRSQAEIDHAPVMALPVQVPQGSLNVFDGNRVPTFRT